MTMGEFEMDAHHKYGGKVEWDINARDGDMRIEFTVYDDAVQDVIRDNFDDLEDTIKQILKDRLEDKWDKEIITGADKDAFIRILEAIL